MNNTRNPENKHGQERLIARVGTEGIDISQANTWSVQVETYF